MANKFSSYLAKDSLEYNVYKAEERLASQLKRGNNEAKYTSIYLPTVISHLKSIITDNPDLTTEEINTILFKEIDDYAKTVYENAYVFGEYLEYLCCQYLSSHPEKYKELSEDLLTSKLDFENIGFENCKTFDEYLLLYIYSRKRDLFKQIFDSYPSFPHTQENYKNFDKLLQDNIRIASKFYFDEYFSLPEVSNVLASDDHSAKKRAKIKEYSTWYRNPRDKKDFELYTNIFMYGSYQYILSDQEYISHEMRKDLSRAISRTVDQLDNLGHLDDYMVDFVFEMSRMEYPEFANVICDNGFPSKEFVEDLVKKSKDLSALDSSIDMMPESERPRAFSKISYLKRLLNQKKEEIRSHLNKEKVKSALGENFLNSSKNVSLEGLLALNSFWANRYVKELNLYAQAMFAINKFDLVDKVREDTSTFISEKDLQSMLIQMDTFYQHANSFLSEQQRLLHSSSKEDDETEYEDGDVEEKIFRFSYEPFTNDISKKFGEQKYASYFSQLLPDCKNDIKDDSNWYIRLFNPIFSSYLMKNEMLNVLLLSIGNSQSETFPNAGIILENHKAESTESLDGKSAYIPYFPIIGLDAGLSFPVRIHIKKTTLIDFLKSFNGNAMLPIYEGSSDFHNPYKKNSPLAASLIMPLTEKIKTLFRKGISKSEFASANSQDYHPHAKFVSHLAFNSVKKVPAHLATVDNSKRKPKSTFVRRYINLENGFIYKLVDDKYVKVDPKTVSKSSQGDDEYEF